DIIYSLQDETFDRDNQLRSLPQTMGAKKALLVSRVCHILAWLGLSTMGFFVPHTWVLLVGTALVGVLLVYEHSLVKPHDLSRVNLAFFTLNGFVSVGFFVFVVLDLWIQSK
ncbi:MAG: UbiA family prenyltransferase, partial [Chthonomonadaceae bacterium]|nr:UbiA family prenyltransferase [Chthonomonadaceae bacterium]